MTNEERTDHLFAILDEAVDDLAEIGLKGPARAIVSYLLDRLPRTLCREHLHEDLTRIAGMIEHEIVELREPKH